MEKLKLPSYLHWRSNKRDSSLSMLDRKARVHAQTHTHTHKEREREKRVKMKINKGRKERLHIESKCKHWIGQKVPFVFK